MKHSCSKPAPSVRRNGYPSLLRTVVTLLEEARRASARTVNVIMTATYWQVGRHIVEFEQAGERRAGYGQQLLAKLSSDLTKRFGRGFSVDHIELMRLFYNTYPLAQVSNKPTRTLLPAASANISESPIRKSANALVFANSESVIRKFTFMEWTQGFPLSWTGTKLGFTLTREIEGSSRLERFDQPGRAKENSPAIHRWFAGRRGNESRWERKR